VYDNVGEVFPSTLITNVGNPSTDADEVAVMVAVPIVYVFVAIISL
jgi:hypothetical protein